MAIDGYNKLLHKIFEIEACRKCGKPLDKNYRLRRRGKLCIDCYVAELLTLIRYNKIKGYDERI